MLLNTFAAIAEEESVSISQNVRFSIKKKMEDGTYEIMYHYNYKGTQMIRQFDLPRNKRTRKFVEKYAKYKIV